MGYNRSNKTMKKRYLFIFLLLVCLYGCKYKEVEPYGYTWYRVKKHGLYGAVDEKGKKLLPCEFKIVLLDTFYINKRDYYTTSTWCWRVEDNNYKKNKNYNISI